MEIDTYQICGEIIKSKKFNDILTEYMAIEISKEYHYTDEEGEMIKGNIRNLIHNEAKDIIEDLTKNYYELNLKSLIEKELRDLTKQDLMKIISNK